MLQLAVLALSDLKLKKLLLKTNIPVLALVVKQSIHEAITLMTKEIARSAQKLYKNELYEMIRENTMPLDNQF